MFAKQGMHSMEDLDETALGSLSELLGLASSRGHYSGNGGGAVVGGGGGNRLSGRQRIHTSGNEVAHGGGGGVTGGIGPKDLLLSALTSPLGLAGVSASLYKGVRHDKERGMWQVSRCWYV